MSMAKILVIAFICEALWETCKMFWQQGKVNIDRIGALIIAELVAFGTGVDLFTLVEIPLVIPFLGIILTGLLISRGANFVHDLLSTVSNLQQNNKISGDA